MVKPSDSTDNKAVLGKAQDRLSATLALSGPVQQVRAVSAARARILAKWGIRTIGDLLWHFPRRYIDMSTRKTIAQARIDDECTIVGAIYALELKRPRPHLDLVEITLTDGTGTLMVTCFRQPWLLDRLSEGMSIAVSGKVEFNYGFKRMTNPFLEVIEGDTRDVKGQVIPIHPATQALTAAWIRRLIANAFEVVMKAEDPLPIALRIKYRLMARIPALHAMHFPHTMQEAHQARRRLAFEEALLLQLHLMMTAHHKLKGIAPVRHCIEGKSIDALNETLPFSLTDEQCMARDAILQEMAAPIPMRHMLLGDVGTGKTAVAAFALVAAVQSHHQAVMMAPTEVLARQHALGLGEWFSRIDISSAFLSASTSSLERERIQKEFACGTIQVLFGTHALLEPDIVGLDISLVVIDEQQRFGVEQRKRLLEKAPRADFLTLTATPIPRTLALAQFGDMSLSYLTERPKNKVKTTTVVLPYSGRGEAYETARIALEEGRQVFVVCPLVGKPPVEKHNDDMPYTEGEKEGSYIYERIDIEDDQDFIDENIHAAREQAKFLRERIFAGWEVGLLHGKLPNDEKQRVMEQFRNNDIQVLVATTVIEVGVDVPNATTMIIEDADRFGLSQLHQLRGRVGRGQHPGQVFLISRSKNPLAHKRLSALERIDDGFALAEFDLSLRQEGDVLGNRQSGISALRLVHVIRDRALIQAAHEDAVSIIQEDPSLTSEIYTPLRMEVVQKFGKVD